MTASTDPTVDLLRRLDELEGEVSVLRARLSRTDTPTQIPDGEFGVLVFEVAGTSYGVPIDQVVEIVRYVRLTAIADVADAIAGAINVRGEVMPVVDARYRLTMKHTRPNLRTSIVLIQKQNHRFGLIVDGVDSVQRLQSEEVRTPNAEVTRFACVSGLVTRDARVIQLIDIAKLLSVHQWQAISEKIESESPHEESSK